MTKHPMTKSTLKAEFAVLKTEPLKTENSSLGHSVVPSLVYDG
jgi:hypothetical protein